jgi:hypothetical protein
MKRTLLIASALLLSCISFAGDFERLVSTTLDGERFTLVENGTPLPIVYDEADFEGVKIAARNLRKDFGRVCGTQPAFGVSFGFGRGGGKAIMTGSLDSPLIQGLVSEGKLDVSCIKGKRETYLITFVDNPSRFISEALVIAGSDKRGTIYGIYELSEQIGVSPWYDWADVPVEHHDNLSMERGSWSVDEPAVTYRGIFLNDEAPCLSSWVRNTYGTNYGNHEFYARVFELILRLRGNFLWPAMWSWSFYADDPLNSKTADDMGIIMGTSHHEPMARNHQEWARRRGASGEWDYVTNRKNLDIFFREGMERARDTEDLITIGMRGDGDAPMGGRVGFDHEYVPHDEETIALLEKIIANQRKIIRQVTGRPAEERPQVWALYKEVQRYYEKGLKIPDDVILLLSDDNWGDVRKVPTALERERKGGWGLYYHVDYVGEPRCSKWLNITPIQNLWEQFELAYTHGIDKLWVLNVGDLKPMEYPITLYMDLARDPERFTAENLLGHTVRFCRQQFGEGQAVEAARILNLYCKYAGRITGEMLDSGTYNLETGEFKQVTDEFKCLETDALRQYLSLPAEYRDAYKQLILFPVQAMCNLYEMYYAQAMNHYLYERGDAAANGWADRVQACFDRDAELENDYNKVMSGGKWNGMMTQAHIGYTTWREVNSNILPETYRIEDDAAGGFVFDPTDCRYTAIEAMHYYSAKPAPNTSWTPIPYMGRTLGGLALMPYTEPSAGGKLSYRLHLPAGTASVSVHVAVKSTLAYNGTGHRYEIGFAGNDAKVVCFNERLNEDPENISSIYYPTVARRVKVDTVDLPVNVDGNGLAELVVKPLDAGIVFEKIVVDYGGYRDSYLLMNETPYRKQ